MDPLSRALRSLDGLSLGDSFGQCFFHDPDAERLLADRILPEATWYFTDDTLMSLSVVESLRRFGRIEQDALAESLAAHYAYDRAYGPSMHRVLERIRQGEPWRVVAHGSFEGQGSWGNGAAMRAGPIGAYFADDLSAAIEQAEASAVVTHAHPEGVAGAIAVAAAAALAVRTSQRQERLTWRDHLQQVVDMLPACEVRSRLVRAQSISRTASLPFAVSVLGNGTGMSAPDTVPLALWCAGHHPDDYREALWLAVSAGGDRDTIGAIVGSVVALSTASTELPDDWRSRREALPTWHIQG